MKNEIDICYLCGQKLSGDVDDDHVPPKQFYPRSIRKIHDLNLFTLPTHESCNKSYQKDEDYFVHSIAPLAKGSYSGNAIWGDISNQLKRPQGKRIAQMILKEFDPRPSGLYLPHGKVVKRFSGQRIWRVVWKITRGLFFKEKEQFLPETTPKLFKNISVDEKPPPQFAWVLGTPSKGQYPGVFDYKYADIPELDNFHIWAMLFWDRLIKFVAFHDPECPCDECKDHMNG